MITSVWDTVSDAELQQSLLGQSRIVRTGIVKGLTNLVTTSKTALFDALADAPDIALLGDPFEPDDYPNYLCVHRVARGIPNTGGQMVRVWLHYETPGGGGTPLERFAAEDVTTLIAEPTGVFPGTAKQLRCSLNSTAPNYETDTVDATLQDRPIIANWPRAMRALILYGLFSDRPSSAVLNAKNKVNGNDWQGLGTGYWRCEGARARYSSRDGMYAVSVGFLSKGDGPGEDWSTYEVPRLQDGTLATVKTSVLEALYDADYAYGVQNDKNSVWKAGLYKTLSFSSVFGDDFPIGD